MFQTKGVKTTKTQIMSSVNFLSKIVPLEIMWENILGWGRPQMTIMRMRIACWIPKATDTHSEYVILITFPLHQWLHERALNVTL